MENRVMVEVWFKSKRIVSGVVRSNDLENVVDFIYNEKNEMLTFSEPIPTEVVLEVTTKLREADLL